MSKISAPQQLSIKSTKRFFSGSKVISREVTYSQMFIIANRHFQRSILDTQLNPCYHRFNYLKLMNKGEYMSTWKAAYDALTDLNEYSDNALGLFALGLRI